MDEDRIAECTGLVEDEITVLESVYDTLLTVHRQASDKPGRLLSLEIPITLPGTTHTNLVSAFNATSGPSSEASSSSSSASSLELAHLPAIKVRLYLPDYYPLHQPPRVISIRAPLPATPGAWLSKRLLAQVQDRLGQIWREEQAASGEGSGVVWRWWEWVGSGESLQDLKLLQDGTLRLSVGPQTPTSTFYNALKSYNAGQLHSSFERTAFSCSICLEDRKGKGCIQMPVCGCVFCVACLSSGWTLAITEGSLENVYCPSVTCTKTRATRERPMGDDDGDAGIDAALVESVVGKDLTDRWEWIKENRKAETDPTYTICPQPWCQKPVPPPPRPTEADKLASEAISRRAIRLSDISKTVNNGAALDPPAPVRGREAAAADTSPTKAPLPISTEDRWERYRCCPSCQFSFCLYCSATWHGPHTPCAFSKASAIVQEYLSHAEGSEERLRIEQRRGKSNIERMVAKWREDEENKKWLEEKTRACAGCGVRVEKSHGCNHMTCGRCGAHFCYRCGTSISPLDPYAHYRKPGSSCFERLFDQEEILRFEREVAGGVHDFEGLPFEPA